jgi:hypothetical protein
VAREPRRMDEITRMRAIAEPSSVPVRFTMVAYWSKI